MKNSATTIGIYSEKKENSRGENSKMLPLSLKDKIADALSSFLSELVISIVVTLFNQLIKIKALECLSGFCYHNISESRLIKSKIK
ncbi:hypothetical protein [Flavobacterium sp.]|uniref:hypothetical protein n=1 Tax=Flavobacterium sp. TaxID=239 RepID=UPI003753E308